MSTTSRARILAAQCALLASAAAAGTVTIAGFEKGMDGFQGTIVRDTSAAETGAACARLVNEKQRWVQATRKIDGMQHELLELRLSVMSRDADRVAVRVVDRTGQNYQQRFAFDADGEWHTIVIGAFNRGETWGGAKDGLWHPPITSLTVVLEQKGTLYLDTIEADLHPEALVPELELRQVTLGNVFLANEAVRFPITSKADRIRWRVTDFWHDQVAMGETPVTDHQAVIEPPPAMAGYFLVHVEALEGDTVFADTYASFAVIPPHRMPDRANSPFGVMTHFAQGMSPDILPLFVKAGIVSVRDEHYWSQVEKERGEYAFPEKSDRYMAECRKAGIDPLIAMTFGNKLYDDKDGPTTPDGYAGYGRYGQAILRQYGDQVRWLEIWNEYNGSWCPAAARDDRPKYYAEMLKAAYDHIKTARPDVQVLGCASVLIPLPYIEGIFRHGGLDAMDGVVIHPYRGQPEGVEREVDELNALIRKYNNGQDKPIWVTETGRHGKDEAEWEKGLGMYELGRQEGARYLTRMYTLLLTRKVAKIYWYLGSDHMNFVSMGLLRRGDDPLGAYAVAAPYVTYATLIRQLDGAGFVQREAWREYTRARVYLFRRGAEDVRVCWATQPAKIRVKAATTLTRVTLVGGTSTVRPVNGEIVLELCGDPFYLVGRANSVEEVDTGVRILADASDDYTKTQGGNNWYYGYTVGEEEFKQMTQRETMWGVTWAGPAKYLTVSRNSMHPEKIGGRDAFSVVRWRSPVTGSVRLVGTITPSEKRGDGIEARLSVGGHGVWTQHVGSEDPGTATFDLRVDVQRGAHVDLAIGPGGNTEYDGTTYSLRILQETGK